jgi:CRP-like cAMP-binding protein
MSFLERKKTSKKSIEVYDKEINTILQFFKRKSLPQILANYNDKELFYSDLGVSEEIFFKAFTLVLTKPFKSTSEILLIATYLFTLSSFTNFFKKAFTNYDEVIYRISYQMTYETLQKDKLMFRSGDKGEKFYIILKGKVSICLAKERTVELSDCDYIKYLAKLKKHSELELLNKCISVNRVIYPIWDDNFDTFLQKAKYMGKKFSPRNSEIIDETISYLENKGDECYENISLEEYMKLFVPDARKYTDMDETYKLTIFEYSNVTILQTGDKFGDIALDNKSHRRTASMITIEESHFGILNKASYMNCIKEANDHIRKSNLIFLLETPLLKDIDKPEKFETKYFNYFVLQKYKRGGYIIDETTKPRDYFFVKEGEYEVIMKKSLAELNEIITHMGGSSSIDPEEKHLFAIPDFKKIYHEKMNMKICIIKEKDAIGFEDIIYKGNYLCNIHCISSRGEAFSIEKANYDLILYKEETNMTVNFNKFVKLKKKLILDKLINLKNMRLINLKLKYNLTNDIRKCQNESSKNIVESSCKILNYNEKSIYNNPSKVDVATQAISSKEQFRKAFPRGNTVKIAKLSTEISMFSPAKNISTETSGAQTRKQSLLASRLTDFNFYIKRAEPSDRRYIKTSILSHGDEIDYNKTTDSINEITNEFKRMQSIKLPRKNDKDIIKEAKELLLINKLRNSSKETSNITKYNLFKPKLKVFTSLGLTRIRLGQHNYLTTKEDNNSVTNITLNDNILSDLPQRTTRVTPKASTSHSKIKSSIVECNKLRNLRARYIYNHSNDLTPTHRNKGSEYVCSVPSLDIDNNREIEMRRTFKTTKFQQNFLLQNIRMKMKKNKSSKYKAL